MSDALFEFFGGVVTVFCRPGNGLGETAITAGLGTLLTGLAFGSHPARAFATGAFGVTWEEAREEIPAAEPLTPLAHALLAAIRPPAGS